MSMKTAIKISTVVDKRVWREFKAMSQEAHQSLSRLLTEALADYVSRKRMRPEFLKQMESSLHENEELGKLLAS